MMMARFIECQIAIVAWGGKARFKRAKVGLMRRGSDVFIAVFSQPNVNQKFLVDQSCIEILPAAIRLKRLEKDLFIRKVFDEQRYSTIMREIKVILNRDKLRQNGKAQIFETFLSNIPTFDALSQNELILAPLSACIIGDVEVGNKKEVPIERDDRETTTKTPSEAIISSECDHIDGDAGRFNQLRHKRCQLTESDIVNHQADQIRSGGIPSKRYSQLENKHLKCIKISNLDSPPKQLWFRSTLNELTLTHCNLTEVPKQLERFSTTLTSLDLSHNRINNLPRTFCCKMNDLILLNLSSNQIQTLPIEIKFFRRLVDLNISDNCLRLLPSTFSDLRSLRTLNVANNNLSQLPAFRTDEIRLNYLDVSHNPLDGALDEANTFEVYPSIDGAIEYNENLICPMTSSTISKRKHFPKLFEIAMLKIVRCDKLLKLASEGSLPRTVVSRMQRDIFKCYKCSKMNILPAYNSSDILDYVEQVGQLVSNGNYKRGMTFMKLICSDCFDKMRS